MKINKNMSELLTRLEVSLPVTPNPGSERPRPRILTVNGRVFLEDEYNRAKHVKPSDFPDMTGLECFVNHVHMPFSGNRESLISCLEYVAVLQRELARSAVGRSLEIIVSVSNDGCTVRFHEIRPGENWLADDIDQYAEEAILVIQVPD